MKAKTFRTMSMLGTVLFIFGLVMATNANISICEAELSLATIQLNKCTEVGGIIEEDTIWMLEDSPYLLIDYVTVEKNVTLTIEPGVIINIDLWGFIIEGELHAVGNETHRIIFESYVKPLSDMPLGIWFAENSSPWNETNKTGCIIEYSQIDFLRLDYGLIRGGYPKISNNILINHASSSAAINSDGEISNNTIMGGYCGILTRSGLVSYNVIKDTKVGIMCSSDSQAPVKLAIVGNLIMDCTRAGIETYSSSPYISNNTIFRNKIGFRIRYYTFNEGAMPIFIYNNFIDNDYNVFVEHEDPRIKYNMSYNWWGTKDISLIEEKIYDQKDNRRLCLINYIPFLNSIVCAPLPPPLTPPLPPYLSDLTITPDEVELGDNVTITFTVANIREERGSYTVTLRMASRLISIEDEAEIDLDGGESEIVSFAYTMDVEGTYIVEVEGLTGGFTVKTPTVPSKPAAFEVSDLVVSPREVTEGEVVTVTVNVTNIGEETGGRTVELKIDGLVTEVGGWHDVTLEGGASKTITFKLTLAEGVHTVGVDGLTGGFTVKPKPSFWDEIPGFPYKSIILGLTVVIILLWRSRNV